MKYPIEARNFRKTTKHLIVSQQNRLIILGSTEKEAKTKEMLFNEELVYGPIKWLLTGTRAGIYD